MNEMSKRSKLTKRKKIIIVTILMLVLVIINNKVFAKRADPTTIVLNPGHGGSYTGCANGQFGIVERDLTMKITRYLEKQLNEYYNVKVVLTHDGVHFPNNDPGDLGARAMVAKNLNADLYVSLHINDSRDRSANGATVYTTYRTDLEKYNHGMTILSNMIMNNLTSLGLKNNGVVNDLKCRDDEEKYKYFDGQQADYYADIRHALKGDREDLGDDFSKGNGVPAVLIEHCYIKHPNDYRFLITEDGIKSLAKADGDAIVKYFDLGKPEEFAKDIDVDSKDINLLLNDKKQIKAKVIGGKDSGIKWSSTNNEIVSVDNKGNINAKKTGHAIIKLEAKSNKNIVKEIKVNVEDVKFNISSNADTVYLKNDKIKSGLFNFEDQKIRINCSPSWEKKTINYEVENPEVLEIKEGKIIPKKEGKTKVVASWKERNLTDTKEFEVIKLKDNTSYEIKNYKTDLKNLYITGFKDNTKLEEFVKNIKLSDNLLYDIVKAKKDIKFIGNGDSLIIKDKDKNKILIEYKMILKGDVNSDGKITPADYILVKKHIMEERKLNELERVSGDTDSNDKITPLDYVMIKNHIMGYRNLYK